MAASLRGPSSDPSGLAGLAPLWSELHRHHREVSEYKDLVQDVGASWERRAAWYRRLLEQGAVYLTADEDGRPIGYAMVAIEDGPDDTFESGGAIAEVVTLVVAPEWRSAGIGQALLRAAEEAARSRGADTVKIAVMSGNRRARAFYETHGYALGEEVLYRRLR